jgi:hypothetical protein
MAILMSEETKMRLLKAKWPGKCSECEAGFAAGEEIAWTGTAAQPACHEKVLSDLKAEDAANAAFQAEWLAKFKAGLLVKSTATDREIVVTGAPDSKIAAAEAFAVVCSIRAAGGKARLIRHTRGGKRYLGREIVNYYGGSNIPHHEGYSYRYEVEAP